jgi:predicted flap endonuclease-1-like 5' DNA nuclease
MPKRTHAEAATAARAPVRRQGRTIVGLFFQIVVFLIVAAVGFVIGWLVRSARAQNEIEQLEGNWQARLRTAETARARSQAQLGSKAHGEARSRASAGDPRLEERVAELQRELDGARSTGAEQRSEIERLQGRLSALQAAAGGGRQDAARQLAPAATPVGAGPRAGEGTPPARLAAPEGQPDDLKKISGIGPGIERTLHELGVFHYRQIAAFTPENVAWVNQRLRFKGRIERENWIGQAKTLVAGGPTS